MSSHPTGYPQDLHDALSNPQWQMCYSTIVSSDLGPSQTDWSTAAACGSVGIIVDIVDDTQLLRVHGSDGGSNGRYGTLGLGSQPDPASCGASIKVRLEGHNEWVALNARPIGMFMFPNPHVFVPGVGDHYRDPNLIISDFPALRFFGAANGKFFEFDRSSGRWAPRDYDEIIKP
jgi:hypothetical protein